MSQKVRDVMTGSPVAVSPDTDLGTVARRMRDENIGAVIVADGDRTSKVGDVVSRDTTTVGPDDDLDRAVRLMRERSVRRLPVVENGRPVAIADVAIEKDEDSALADISAAEPNR